MSMETADLLQLADLIVGAITYDLKLASGIIIHGDKYKRRFVEHLKNNLGVQALADGFKNRHFNIFVDKDVKQRLPLDFGKNEKEPSS